MYLISKLIMSVFLILALSHPSYATVYFSWTSENESCGAVLPNPPFFTRVEFKGRTVCGETPEGTKYIEWQVPENLNNANTEVSYDYGLFPVNNLIGRTFYLAYFFNFTRTNGRDIWHLTGQSADKGVELSGDGVRWLVSPGHWSPFVANQPGRYTVWLGNPTYHLDALEVSDIYPPNRSGYTFSNPLQLEYEKWHAAVMAIKMATDNTGSATVYINGVKIAEYTNIRTAASSSATISKLTLNGTIAQPDYDAPPHYRRFDGLLLTDDWQDIINGGYVAGSPAAPVNLRVQ